MANQIDLEALEAQKLDIDREIAGLRAEKQALNDVIDRERRRADLERKLGGITDVDKEILAQLIGPAGVETGEKFGQASA